MEILEQLLQVVRTIEGVDYKVVISIDDLDRCPMPKIKSLLESVHILLSNQHSPFVSIIAVDPKLAELAFQVGPESDKQPLLQERQVKEKYLDKIINVPFYLPKVSLTKSFSWWFFYLFFLYILRTASKFLSNKKFKSMKNLSNLKVFKQSMIFLMF